MKIKRALVVDDSKVARTVLADILKKQGVAVDTTESAEDALEYLLETRPDVIFLDHVMPGMDGFQAMRAIKQNPETATIPIMMYTSKEGEVYVGQARALGAAGCLPKQVQPVDVAKVLESLSHAHIPHGEQSANDAVSEDNASAVVEIDDTDAGSSVRERMLETVELAEADAIQSALKQLLERQRSTLRKDIGEECERATRTVMTELQAANGAGVGKRQRHMSGLMRLALLGIVIVLPAVVLFKLYLNAETEKDQLEQRYTRLLARQESLQSTVERNVQSQGVLGQKYQAMQASFDRQQSQAERERRQLLDTVAWAISERSTLDYGQQPIDEAQLDAMRGLLARLDELGFAGTLRINRHHGRFCLMNVNGIYMKPRDDTSFGSCTVIDNPVDWDGANTRVLEQLLNNELVPRGSRIRIQVVDTGVDRPRNLYPPLTAALTAGDWNRVAISNNRLEFTLLPDEKASHSPSLQAVGDSTGGLQ